LVNIYHYLIIDYKYLTIFCKSFEICKEFIQFIENYGHFHTNNLIPWKFGPIFIFELPNHFDIYWKSQQDGKC